ncbi:hypothetical protein Ddye_019020 [Dipteronia dyeriana]|uniref:Uncharacterized protein n=1 Tax=Dipteronia dyeriana TaxID=168575 RepID=A0AAD9TY03_9ROSI|nr:hypothetical protein Ddye_019020 [Dipteronia dyeriana]
MLNRSPVNCGARGPWSRASSSSSSVDLQPVTILHSLQIPADPRFVFHVEFRFLLCFMLASDFRLIGLSTLMGFIWTA